MELFLNGFNEGKDKLWMDDISYRDVNLREILAERSIHHGVVGLQFLTTVHIVVYTVGWAHIFVAVEERLCAFCEILIAVGQCIGVFPQAVFAGMLHDGIKATIEIGFHTPYTNGMYEV